MSSKGHKFTAADAAENGRKGGIASGIAKRKKKSERERYAALLSMALDKGKVKDLDDVKNFAALSGKNVTVGDTIAIAMVQRALSGDKDAARLIYNLIGEMNPQISDSADEETADDGFLSALGATAADDWSDGSDG